MTFQNSYVDITLVVYLERGEKEEEERRGEGAGEEMNSHKI